MASTPEADRRRALERLASEAEEVTAALARARERVASLMAAEGAAGHFQRLPRAQQDAARETGWELRRLEAELRRLRAEFARLRDARLRDARPG